MAGPPRLVRAGVHDVSAEQANHPVGEGAATAATTTTTAAATAQSRKVKDRLRQDRGRSEESSAGFQGGARNTSGAKQVRKLNFPNKREK